MHAPSSFEQVQVAPSCFPNYSDALRVTMSYSELLWAALSYSELLSELFEDICSLWAWVAQKEQRILSMSNSLKMSDAFWAWVTQSINYNV